MLPGILKEPEAEETPVQAVNVERIVSKPLLLHGDCLIESDNIESGSVDLILTDLPYGNMKNAPSTWDKSKTAWDTALDPNTVYEVANRILRRNGKMVLFSQEPYTSKMVTSAMPNLPFCYRAFWLKDSFANALGCNKNMVMFSEDVLVFSKFSGIIEKSDYTEKHPLRDYFKTELAKSGLTVADIVNEVGNSATHYFTNGDQFRLPTETNYLLMQKTGFWREEYTDIVGIHSDFKLRRAKERAEYLRTHNERYPSTFNLWEGNKYKSNIMKYKKDYTGHHPTQKPVLLLEDLIKTFSNEGDTVVDLTMGSGSTGVACMNTGRNFIGIELNQEYYQIATKRIEAC